MFNYNICNFLKSSLFYSFYLKEIEGKAIVKVGRHIALNDNEMEHFSHQDESFAD